MMHNYIIIALRAKDNLVYPSRVKGYSVAQAKINFLSRQKDLHKILSVTYIPDNCAEHFCCPVWDSGSGTDEQKGKIQC